VGVTSVVGDLILAAQEAWRDEELRGILKRLVPDYEPSLAGMPVRQETRSRDNGRRRREDP